jgi:hypothetical protein
MISEMCNSKYYHIEEVNEMVKLSKSRTKLSIVHCNIRSATKNSIELSNYLEALYHKFYILAMSETWLTDSNSSILGFPEYSQVHTVRNNKKEVVYLC